MRSLKQIFLKTGTVLLSFLLALAPLSIYSTSAYAADDSAITESNYVLPDPEEGLDEDIANGSDIGGTEATDPEDEIVIDFDQEEIALASDDETSYSYSAETKNTSNYATELAKFPQSYQVKLKALHEQYPNWIFVADYTGRDWSTALAAENKSAVSLIQQSSTYTSDLLLSKQSGDCSNGSYVVRDAGGWVSCNDLCTAFYLDPRNFLDAKNIMMFESLSFNSDYETIDGIKTIISGSFMDKSNITYITTAGKSATINTTYAQTIYNAGVSSGVNPYFLASKIINEVGTTGSKSVTGNYSGYTGYYNFYNIGASSSTNPIALGLTYAKGSGSYSRPWNTPVKAITGGAQWIAANYMSGGQNTAYYQRFNTSESASVAYTHQYATCIYYAASTAASTYNAYNSSSCLTSPRVFVIPVYNNMPGETTQYTSTKMSVTPSTQTATVSETSNLRDAASTNSNLIVNVPSGATVTVLDKVRTTSASYSYFNKNPYWYKVSYNGYTGYISQKNLTLTNSITVAVNGTKSVAVTKAASDVTYFSENTSIAQVSSSGNVTGVKSGTTHVFAYTSGGGFDMVTVKVSGTTTTVGADTIYSTEKNGYTIDSVNLRSKASTASSSTIIKELSKATLLTITGENGIFYKTTLGYVSKSHVQLYTQTLYSSAKAGYVNADSVNLRSCPSTSMPIVKTMANNTAVSVLGEAEDFYILSNGFIAKTYVTLGTSSVSDDTLYDASKTGTITGGVYLRSAPSTSSSILSTLKKGTSITILGENGNYYKVSNGYISKNYVKITEAGSDTIYITSKKGTTTTDVNLRSGPSTSSDVLKTLAAGTTLTLTGENGDFYKTDDGYVAKEYVKLSDSTDNGDSLYSSSKKGTITAGVNLRSGPSTTYSIVKVLSKGTSVTVLGENGSFYKLSNGYVSKKYVSFSSSSVQYGVVTSKVNLRSSASTSSSIVKVLTKGTVLTITGESGTFYKTANGYVSKKYVSLYKDSLYSTSVKGVTTDVLNVRSGPSTKYDVVKQLSAGTSVTLLGTNNGFYKISSGYISMDYVSK